MSVNNSQISAKSQIPAQLFAANKNVSNKMQTLTGKSTSETN